jgi:hypothetical protein
MQYTESEKKVKKSARIKKRDFQFSLRDAYFGRKLSFLYIGEAVSKTENGAERKQLFVERTLRTYNSGRAAPKPGLFHMRPMHEGRTVPYATTMIPSMLEMRTEYGYVQFCFDNKELLRIRGRGVQFRFFAELKPHEFCIPRMDGTWQLSYHVAGEFLFVPLKGRFELDSEWEWKRLGGEDPVMDIFPDSDGEFEIAIHYLEANTERLAKYRPFDECVEEAQADFDEWLSMYPEVPSKYEELKKIAAYCVWICYIAPRGILKDNIIVFDKTNGAFSWHQTYFAMAAAGGNIDVAVQIMRSMFYYQDEYGEIPDIVDDRYINILATKPPFHGFAVLYMMEHAGDKMTAEHCKILYEPLMKWYNWWMTLRDTDNDGVPQYNQGCESGMDFTLMLAKGTPVECPDLIAYMILLAEALGKLAGKMGMGKEAADWEAKSKKLLDVLIKEFWDGEKFIARMSGSHELIDFDEIEAYAPMMLGKRLPHEIAAKIAGTLSDPDKFYTHAGFRSAPKQYKDGVALPGFLMSFTQIKLVPGLYEAGWKDLARDVLTGFCEANYNQHPDFGYSEFDPAKPGTGATAIGFGKGSSLAGAIFLVMAGYLSEISKEGYKNV